MKTLKILFFICCTLFLFSCEHECEVVEKLGYTIRVDTIYQYKVYDNVNGVNRIIIIPNKKYEIKDIILTYPH